MVKLLVDKRSHPDYRHKGKHKSRKRRWKLTRPENHHGPFENTMALSLSYVYCNMDLEAMYDKQPLPLTRRASSKSSNKSESGVRESRAHGLSLTVDAVVAAEEADLLDFLISQEELIMRTASTGRLHLNTNYNPECDTKRMVI